MRGHIHTVAPSCSEWPDSIPNAWERVIGKTKTTGTPSAFRMASDYLAVPNNFREKKKRKKTLSRAKLHEILYELPSISIQSTWEKRSGCAVV
jgi:hypothetical protein